MALEHTTRSDEAYTYIRQKIIEGAIPFGERLHIDNLARETGFSITPVREALNRLVTYGLAEMYPHRGIFVVNPDRRDVIEMCEARLCLELFMAEPVVRNATATDIQAMEMAAQWARTTAPSEPLLFEEGLHGRYVRIAGNQFLVHLYQQVMTLLNVLYLRRVGSCEDGERLRCYLEAHYVEEMKILRAIVGKDVSAVQEAVKAHLANVQDLLLETLPEGNQARGGSS